MTQGNGKLPVLGEVIFWRMEDIRILKEDAELYAERLGLQIEATSLSGVRALTKALNESTRAEDEDLIWRKGEDKSYYVASVKTKEGIKTKTEVTIKEMGSGGFEFDGDYDLKKRIEEIFEKWNGYIDSGIMIGILVNLIEGILSGVRVRKGGGVYFVKSDRKEILNVVEKWCQKVGVSLSRIQLVDEDRTMSEVAQIFVEKIAEDLKVIKEYVHTTLSEDLRKNRRGIETRLKDIEKMKSDLEMYKGILGGKAEDIEKNLEEVKMSVFMLRMEE